MLRPRLLEKNLPNKNQKSYSSGSNRVQQQLKLEKLNPTAIQNVKQLDCNLTNTCINQIIVGKSNDNPLILTQRTLMPALYKNNYLKSSQGSRFASQTKTSFNDPYESKDSICISQINSSQIQYESDYILNESISILKPGPIKEKIVCKNIKPINSACTKLNVVRLTKQKKYGSMNMNSSNTIKTVNQPNDQSSSIHNSSCSRKVYSGESFAVPDKRCAEKFKAETIPPSQNHIEDLINPKMSTSINININNFNQKNYHVPMIKGSSDFSVCEEIIVCPEQQHFLSVITAKKNRYLAKKFDKVESSDDMISF